MCEICESMLTEEHSPERMRLAKKQPCPKCKVFAAGDPIDGRPARRGKGPRRRLKPRYQTCYHCWTKENLHEECPICNRAKAFTTVQ